MKLFLLGIILLSFGVHAENWMPVSAIKAGTVAGYSLKSSCEQGGEQCLDVGSDLEMVKLGMVSVVTGWGPETDAESCDDEADCTAKLGAKGCGILSKFISADYSRVYCVENKGKVLSKDQSAYDTYKAAQAIKAADDAAEANALARMECGRKVIAKLLVRNASKQLSVQQVGSLSTTYAPIQGLLLNGSLETARGLILAVLPDGVIITDADKTALVEKLDSCKPQ